MTAFKAEKIVVAEKIALYRAAKAIYTAPNGQYLTAEKLFKRASAGLLSEEKREHSVSYGHQLLRILRGEKPKSKASKSIQWWPNEWDTIIEHYELARSEGKNIRDSAMFANSAMPKDRQRNADGPVFPSEISRISKALDKLPKPIVAAPTVAAPTVADPFPNVPTPPPIDVVPDPAPVAPVAEQMQTPRMDMSGSMGEAMAGLGPALSVVLTETLKMLGEAVGREIGKHVEAAVESIGNKMQASVAESLYQMRMGLLSGRQPAQPTQPTPQTIQGGQPIPERKPEPPKLVGNGYTGRKRILIIGLLPQQEQMIKNENTHIDFKFMSREAPGDRIKHVAQNMDATYIMLNFVSHTVTDALRKAAGGPGYAGVKGGMDSLTLRLRDDFPRAGVTRDTPRKQAEAAFAGAQH